MSSVELDPSLIKALQARALLDLGQKARTAGAGHSDYAQRAASRRLQRGKKMLRRFQGFFLRVQQTFDRLEILLL